MKLRKLMLLVIGLSSSSMVLANWESAYLKEEHRGNGLYNTCMYETISGYRFSLQLTFCQYSVEVNTETGMVRK